MKQKIKIKLLTPTAKIPVKAHVGDIYDVFADETITITDDCSTLVSTGIACEIPEGYQLRLYNRSSGPLKNKIVLANGLGVIDTAFTGEIKGQFFCIKGTHTIDKGDRIMQMEVVPIIEIEFEEVKELSQTDRGERGFGSTGK